MLRKLLAVISILGASICSSATLAEPVTVTFKLRASNPIYSDSTVDREDRSAQLEAATGLSISQLTRGVTVIGSYTYDPIDTEPDVITDRYEGIELGFDALGGTFSFVGGRSYDLVSPRFTMVTYYGTSGSDDEWTLSGTLPNSDGEYDGLMTFGAAYASGLLGHTNAWPDAGDYRGRELYTTGSIEWGLYFAGGYSLALTLQEINGQPLTPVPEPGALGLLGLGMTVVLIRQRRRRALPRIA